jgi:hypothetical protein
MSKTTIARIEGNAVHLFQSDSGDEVVKFIGKARIDNDGVGGNPDNDPHHQENTSLQLHGKSLNAYEDSFIAIPPVIISSTNGIVLGSLCLVTNLENHRFCFAVVGDVGPDGKIGEVSPACAEQIGVDPNAVTGGSNESDFNYDIFVGVPAVIGEKKYVLQAS